jgi:hypothetical protein
MCMCIPLQVLIVGKGMKKVWRFHLCIHHRAVPALPLAPVPPKVMGVSPCLSVQPVLSPKQSILTSINLLQLSNGRIMRPYSNGTGATHWALLRS